MSANSSEPIVIHAMSNRRVRLIDPTDTTRPALDFDPITALDVAQKLTAMAVVVLEAIEKDRAEGINPKINIVKAANIPKGLI